jgi:hypothetical protein
MPKPTKTPAPRTVQDIHRGERVSSFSQINSRAVVEFNWYGMGCPGEICCRLGDQLIIVPLPKDFPRAPLHYRKAITAYDVMQTLEMASDPHRTPTNAQIKVSTSELIVPFQIKLGGHQLLAGFVWLCPVDRTPVYDSAGNLLWYIVTPQRTEFERSVLRGDACRPNCRYTSLVQTILEYPWKEEYADIEDDFIVQHYKRRVGYNWTSFHCENGKWKYIRNDVDTQTERKSVKKKIEK